MSRIIKPDESKVFSSARKFQKKPFALDLRHEKKGKVSPPSSVLSKDDRPVTPQAELIVPEDIVPEAERRAEQMVREAEQKANDIRRRATEEGRAQGIEQAKKRVDEQLERSSQALSSFIDQIKEQESELMQTCAPKLADIAVQLAEKIIHKEIEKDSSLVIAQAEEAISRILEREKLIVRVNPSDEELMKRHKEQLVRMFDGVDKIEIIGDSHIEKGGCIVETNLIKVDAQPASQLKAARKSLLAEAEK